MPLAIRRLRRSQLASAAFFRQHDMVLTPTLATETPRVGHLDPTQDYDTILGRLLEWVAFTPLQNATGDPAVSLPLATTAAGLPQGMMFAAGCGPGGHPPGVGLRARGSPALAPDPGLTARRRRTPGKLRRLGVLAGANCADSACWRNCADSAGWNRGVEPISCSCWHLCILPLLPL